MIATVRLNGLDWQMRKRQTIIAGSGNWSHLSVIIPLLCFQSNKKKQEVLTIVNQRQDRSNRIQTQSRQFVLPSLRGDHRFTKQNDGSKRSFISSPPQSEYTSGEVSSKKNKPMNHHDACHKIRINLTA